MTEPAPFAARFHVHRFTNAAYFAGRLFEESFGSPFPVPPAASEPSWLQYVAFYRWPDERIEVVGFCNYLPFERAWLGGGLCVQKTFYLRLPPAHFAQCRASGGVAQLVMEHAARELADCDACFAYVGDARSLRVCSRVGYERTDREYVMVKWFRETAELRRSELIDRVARFGPF